MDNDRRREALRVHFTVDGEAEASEVGGAGGGEGGLECVIHIMGLVHCSAMLLLKID